MNTFYKVIDPKFAELRILLVTAGRNSKVWNNHYEWHHPPDTVMIYTQACQALSKFVNIVTLESLFDRGFAEQFFNQQGLVVDIVGGLFDLELISLPAAIAHSLNMSCFPANTKNYITTHDKLHGKHIARNCGIRTSKTLSGQDLVDFKGAVIQKPICGGDSVGIEFKETWPTSDKPRIGSFVEEFVLGHDATIHLIRNGDGKSYSVLEHLYSSDSTSNWFDVSKKGEANRLFGEPATCKERSRYKGGMSKQLLTCIHDLLGCAGYPFLGRIDFRQTKLKGEVGIDDMIFLELNVAPTISNANNWYDGIKEKYGEAPSFKRIESLPIHPAAKSLGIMLREFYAQSLSMQGNNPVREENLPNWPASEPPLR